LLLKELGEEATYYYHPDHLGSVSVVSNHRGEPYERVEYLPFGEIWIEETDPATGYIPFRFTSKELDEETGLYYYGARYYEPATSRWMSPDPAGFGLINPMEPDSEGGWQPKQSYSIIEAVNWYSYVSNNPVKYVDPTGDQQIGPGVARRTMNAFVAAMGAPIVAIADAVGQAGNFVANLVTGDVSVSANAHLSADVGGLISGKITAGSDGVSFTVDSDLSPKEVGEQLQGLLGANLELSSDGVSLGIDAKVVDVSVSVSSNGDGTATLGLEVSKDIGNVLSAGGEIGLTASTQEGPFGTIKNQKSPVLNEAAGEVMGAMKYFKNPSD